MQQRPHIHRYASTAQRSSPRPRTLIYALFGLTAALCFGLYLKLSHSAGDRNNSTPHSAQTADRAAATTTAHLAQVVDQPVLPDAPDTGDLLDTDPLAPNLLPLSLDPEDATAEAADASDTNHATQTLDARLEEQWQSVQVKPGDTLSKILQRIGLSTKEVRSILSAHASAKQLDNLKPGQRLKLRHQADQIEEIHLALSPGHTLEVRRGDAGFEVHEKVIPLEKRLAFGKGEIQGSLFRSGKGIGLDQNLLAQLVEIFGWNIDFALDLKPHDTFKVLYEEKCLEGERIKTGAVLAAELVNGGTRYQAVRYTDHSGHTSYFSPEGYGMHQAFLRSPVNFTRISSHFGMRHHPIMHKMKHHKGVDYVAPHGAPVQATADGKVVFVGQRNGYGKAVELQHGARYTTFYAHLSRFPKKLRPGASVRQGEVIGFVGRTGLATNNHLHYECRVDGIHRNPLTLALPRKAPISESQKPHFVAHAKKMIQLMNSHEYQLNVARRDSPDLKNRHSIE